jgi:hypothetical protein
MLRDLCIELRAGAFGYDAPPPEELAFRVPCRAGSRISPRRVHNPDIIRTYTPTSQR